MQLRDPGKLQRQIVRGGGRADEQLESCKGWADRLFWSFLVGSKIHFPAGVLHERYDFPRSASASPSRTTTGRCNRCRLAAGAAAPAPAAPVARRGDPRPALAGTAA